MSMKLLYKATKVSSLTYKLLFTTVMSIELLRSLRKRQERKEKALEERVNKQIEASVEDTEEPT